MLKLVMISDPKTPGSFSHALVISKETEQILRENIHKSGCIANEGTVLDRTSDFWQFQKLMKQTMKF